MNSDRPAILLDVPDITGDLVRALVERGGARIARRANGEALRDALRRTGADVLVVSADSGDVPRESRELLLERAALRVVAVASDGRSAVFSRLRPEEISVEDISVERLVAEVSGEG